MVAFFLNSAIAPNGLEVSMGARETVCSSFVLLVKADNCRKELVKFVRLQGGIIGQRADVIDQFAAFNLAYGMSSDLLRPISC